MRIRRRQTVTKRVRDAIVGAIPTGSRRSRRRSRKRRRRERELRAAVAQLDIPWARSAPARMLRENFMRLVMNPVLDHYAARGAAGAEQLAALKGPVILVANHASHMDTPVILSALPRRLRKHTAVAAAADYFYRNKAVASLVSLLFNTVPIERKGGGLSKTSSHLDNLLDQGWNLLLYPEGTRSRGNGPGRVRRGAAVLAANHNLTIVPIRVTGTAEAMPPGQIWPKRLRGRLLSKRHRIEVTFGEPIPPLGDAAAMIERVQSYFENGDSGAPSLSPYRRRTKA
jgi:1-acyl-sn-glycerol-3-phosphate acyltransferase